VPASTKTKVPAVEGWFTSEGEPRLLGTRCTACGTYFFPPRAMPCNNPDCGSTAIESVPLSNRGRVWSYTENHYAPPAPFMAPQKLVVLGQVVGDWHAGDLAIGQELTLVIDTLYEDDEHEYLIWKWSP
jgi:uncharacterized protein